MSLIARTPMTGSQLVSLLRRYPLAGSGKSPGAVYPALYRLEEAGLVCARTRRPGTTTRMRRLYAGRRRIVPRSGRTPAADADAGGPAEHREPRRGPQEFGLTRAGVERLRRWATKRVTRKEVLERPQHLLLRFAMCTGLAGPTAARRLALQCRRVCTVLARELAGEVDRFRGSVSPSTHLALECTLALIEARVAWSRRAEVELARHAARKPEEDDPPAVRRARTALGRLPEPLRGRIRWPRRDGPPPTPPPKPTPPAEPELPDWENVLRLRRRLAGEPAAEDDPP